MINYILHKLSFVAKKGQFLKNTLALKNLENEIIDAYELRHTIGKDKEVLRKNTFQVTLSDTAPSSSEIFSIDGSRLPCWLEQDVNPNDDWLNAENYYPLYYKIYSANRRDEQTRLLEIGVRTGYMGCAFTRAINGKSFYYGVDPNLYIQNGLSLAQASFGALKKNYSEANFVLHYGYSSSLDTQYSLKLNEKFDFIHVDGDHTLLGKIIDLKLAKELLKSDGLVLVDDYENVGIVAQAVEIAIAKGWYNDFCYLNSFRGLAVLR